MKLIFYVSLLILLCHHLTFSQIPDTVWTKTFGGSLADVGNSVKQTIDGGFIVAATTSSFGSGGQDIYLIKTDENGDTLWTKTFGGTGNDRAANVVQTNDNGYAVFGTTNSLGNGADDFLLWKTDSLGNTEWFKTYGTSLNEVATEGKQMTEGGYLITGYFYDQRYKSIVLKLNNQGEIIWEKLLVMPGSADLWANSVEQATNNNYFIGCTWGHDYFGGYAYEWYMFQLSEDGDSLFSTYYFNVGADFLDAIRNTTDGNLILGGSTAYEYIWLRKRNPNGGTIWSRIISVSVADVSLSDIEPTPDNGYIISAIIQVSNNNPLRDIVLLKTDADGFVQWEKRIIGTGIEDALSVYPTNDEGYIVTGRTNSIGAGGFDVWLLKFKYNPPPEISVIYPNGGEHWMMWDTVQVEWSATGMDSVKIELSLSDGIDWMTIAESVPNTGTFDWFVQAPYTSWYCLMKISDTSDSTIFDISDTTFTIDMFPSVEDSSNLFPAEFSLSQNFPNPFNPSTSIQYAVSSRQFVTLNVYDVLGNEIATLVNEEKQPGIYEVEFSATGGPESSIKQPASGIYFYQLKAGDYIETKKMILLK